MTAASRSGSPLDHHGEASINHLVVVAIITPDALMIAVALLRSLRPRSSTAAPV
jgi:hypothetical protein